MSLANLTTFNTGTGSTDLPTNAKQVLFSRRLEKSTGGVADPFQNFIGPDGGRGYPVIRKTDLESTAGQTVHFSKAGALRKAGKRGEATLRGNEEKMRVGTDSVTIDFVRHATGWSRRALKLAAAGQSLPTTAAMMLDEWLGRMRTDFIMQRLRGKAQGGVNICYPSSARNSIPLMSSADYITPGFIERTAALMNQNLAAPIASKKMPTGVQITNFLFLGPDTVLQPLFGDSDYKATSQYELGNGESSIREGGFAKWRGHGIFNWNAGDEDGDGPVGSFFNPKAFLGSAAIAAGTAALTILGGGSGYTSGTDYFRYWPGNVAFTQYQDETITENIHGAGATDDYFVKIYNITGADAGKWGFYRYTGAAGNLAGTSITTAAYSATTGRGGGRLSGTANGGTSTEHTTVGTVVWDSAVNTDAHPVGSPMYLANKSGQVIGYVGALGSDAVRIAYGGGAGQKAGASIAGTKYDENDDYEMQIAAAIEAVMGVDVRLDTLGRPRGFALMPCVYTPVGI